MSERWYAVHTRPRLEDRASYYLRRQGYRTFYPFTREKRYFGRRRQMREEDRPLFSRYIFVELSKLGQNLFEVNETYGVSTVVHIGGEPLVIPAGVITELMEMTDAHGMIAPKPKVHWFTGRPGDMVELKDEAPYYGLLAELASVADVDRRDEITVFLELLGARREVTVSVNAVAKIIAA